MRLSAFPEHQLSQNRCQRSPRGWEGFNSSNNIGRHIPDPKISTPIRFIMRSKILLRNRKILQLIVYISFILELQVKILIKLFINRSQYVVIINNFRCPPNFMNFRSVKRYQNSMGTRYSNNRFLSCRDTFVKASSRSIVRVETINHDFCEINNINF